MGKYTEAETLQMQVLDARKIILRVEHPDTILSMSNSPVTYRNLARYTEPKKLEIQAHELKNRVSGAESHTVTTTANVQEAQEIPVLYAGSTVPGEEKLHVTQAFLNLPVQAVLPDTIMNTEKKGMYFSNSCLNPFDIFILSPISFQTCKESFKI